MRSKLLKTLLIGMTAMVIAGCGGSDGGSTASATAKSALAGSVAGAPTSSSDVEKSKTALGNVKGYASSSKIWDRRDINVCWNLDPATFADTAELRGVARQAVRDSWEKNSALAFLGWNMCDSNPGFHGIRIVVANVVPHVTSFGKDLDAPDQALYLNFDFQDVDWSCVTWQKPFCVKVTAVHEFGHALGFQHEQLRPDAPKWCMETAPTYPFGDTLIGAWDTWSVMNYCNPPGVWEGDGNLSSTDIEMVQNFYGKPNGTLYTVTKQNGPVQEITAFDTLKGKTTAVIKLPTDTKSLIQDLIASPDGKRVYVVSSFGTGSYLSAIDTATNTVAYVRPSGVNVIKQLEVSLDSNTLYALVANAGTSGQSAPIELLDAQTGLSNGSISIPTPAGAGPGGQIYMMAKPQFDGDKIYVLTADFFPGLPRTFSVTQLSVSEKRMLRQIPIVAPGEAPFDATGLAMALSIDEKTMFFPIASDDEKDFGRFAALDLTSGQMKKFPSFSSPTMVKNLQALDQHRFLFGNQNANHGPMVFDTETGLTSEIMSSSDLTKSTGYPYVFSVSGKEIFSSQLGAINSSTVQDDGNYKSTAIGVTTNDVAGGVEHVFAFAKN